MRGDRDHPPALQRQPSAPRLRADFHVRLEYILLVPPAQLVTAFGLFVEFVEEPRGPSRLTSSPPAPLRSSRSRRRRAGLGELQAHVVNVVAGRAGFRERRPSPARASRLPGQGIFPAKTLQAIPAVHGVGAERARARLWGAEYGVFKGR